MSSVRGKIDQAYWDRLLLKGEKFPSVYALCKEISLNEKEFYEEYSSLEMIEKHFWKNSVEEVVRLLEKDEDFSSYGSEQKWLSFLFTYIEHIGQYRSRFLERFPRKPSLCAARRLQGAEDVINDFVAQHIDLHSCCEGMSEKSSKKLSEGLDCAQQKAFLAHFCLVVVFYLEDESEYFERTDAYIEKTVRLAFQLRDNSIFDSALDLAKFLRK